MKVSCVSIVHVLLLLSGGAFAGDIQQNKPESEVAAEGWIECYSGRYDTEEGAMFGENVKAACEVSDEVMLGCRPDGASDWQLVGWGSPEQAFMDTGASRNGLVTVDGNIQWYFNDDYSLGFSPTGEGVRKDKCDTSNLSSADRLCWHTLNDRTSRGWRCGTAIGSNLNYERKAWIRMLKGGSGQGDPHFKTWEGLWYNFHGVCDLLFLKAEALAMEIHLRTKAFQQIAFIETAAIKVGDDTLEVGSYGQYFYNGVENAHLPTSMADKYAVVHTKVNKIIHTFVVTFNEGTGESLVVKTMKDMVSVTVVNATYTNFGSSVGMMGHYVTGKLLARDGDTVIDSWKLFGEEWQVSADEPSLFQGPSHFDGNGCAAPEATSAGRRLGQSLVTTQAAEKACASYTGTEKDMCVFDVMAMEDLDAAGVYGAY